MKCILPMLLIVSGAIYTKAQVKPVTMVSYSDRIKQPAVKINADSAAVKNFSTIRPRISTNAGATVKVTDGALSTDKLANDILLFLHDTENAEGQKTKP